MKTFRFLAALAIVMLCSCQQDFTGYVVFKEYVPLHMDDQEPKTVQQATFIPAPIIVAHPIQHTPELIKSKWFVYVANKDAVRQFEVDSVRYLKIKICDKITFK
jgi:hypothetical protein